MRFKTYIAVIAFLFLARASLCKQIEHTETVILKTTMTRTLIESNEIVSGRNCYYWYDWPTKPIYWYRYYGPETIPPSPHSDYYGYLICGGKTDVAPLDVIVDYLHAPHSDKLPPGYMSDVKVTAVSAGTDTYKEEPEIQFDASVLTQTLVNATLSLKLVSNSFTPGLVVNGFTELGAQILSLNPAGFSRGQWITCPVSTTFLEPRSATTKIILKGSQLHPGECRFYAVIDGENQKPYLTVTVRYTTGGGGGGETGEGTITSTTLVSIAEYVRILGVGATYGKQTPTRLLGTTRGDGGIALWREAFKQWAGPFREPNFVPDLPAGATTGTVYVLKREAGQAYPYWQPE